MRSVPVRAFIPLAAVALIGACIDIPDFADGTHGGGPPDGAPGGDDGATPGTIDGALPDGALPPGSDAGCGDLANDPSNCGRCGHSCGGAQCSGGTCTPSTVRDAGSGALVTDLKVRSGSLFWTETTTQNGARAMRCALPACATAVTVASSSAIMGTAVSSDTEYVIHDATTGDVGVTAYSFDGTAGAQLLHLYGINGPADVDDASFVYFSFPTQQTGGVLEFGKREESCNDCAQAWVVAPTDTQVSMQIVGETAWWTTASSLVRCPTGGASTSSQTTTTLLQGKTNLGGLAVAGGRIYWADTEAGTISACSTQLDDCSGAPAIATGQASPLRVAVDADRVSWTVAGSGPGIGGGAVMTCAAPSCAGGAWALAKNQAAPAEIATDGASVFWATGSLVLRVPK